MSNPMPWIKIYTEILDDHKFGVLPDALKWRFVEICLLAGECDAEGYLTNGEEALDLTAIAWRLRKDPDELAADLEVLVQRGFMMFEDGIWLVTNFAKRQGRPQHEKRALWRERKQRQKVDKPTTPQWDEPIAEEELSPIELEQVAELDETDAGITRESRDDPAPREEKSRVEKRSESRAVARTDTYGDSSPPTNGLTEAQRYWLTSFGAKRFANTVQREAVLSLERTYGTDVLVAGIQWAAKQGMGMGKALTSLETALPKWGKSKAAKGDVVTVKGL